MKSSTAVYGNLFLFGIGVLLLIVAEVSAVQEGAPGAVICFFPGGALIGLGAILWHRERMIKRHQQELRRIESSHQQELDTLTNARVGELEKLRLKSWLKGLRSLPWSDKAVEVEIEVKFVFPLLRYLGYEDKDIAIRVPVPMQEGSVKTVREADWVVWDENGSALVVLEAKAPSVPLGEAVAKQARSYAFRLGSPIYITTNGKEVQVFHRGVIDDRCVLSCTVGQLSEKWEAMQEVAGKSNVIALRNRLIGEE